MSWTKRQFLDQAYNEIGYASYAYDLPEEQIVIAKYRLDAFVASWHGKGLFLSYPLSDNQTADDIDVETNVPDWANEAILANLALRLAPTIGKQVSQDLRKAARSGFKTLLTRASLPRERQFPETLPRGTGNRPWIYDDHYFEIPREDLEVFEGDGSLDFE